MHDGSVHEHPDSCNDMHGCYCSLMTTISRSHRHIVCINYSDALIQCMQMPGPYLQSFARYVGSVLPEQLLHVLQLDVFPCTDCEQLSRLTVYVLPCLYTCKHIQLIGTQIQLLTWLILLERSFCTGHCLWWCVCPKCPHGSGILSLMLHGLAYQQGQILPGGASGSQQGL